MNNKMDFIYSWPAIIVSLILFWPLGLFLLIKRTTKDKATVMKSASGKCFKVIAIVLLAFGGLGVLSSFDPFNFGGLVFFLFFIAGGIILLNKANKIKTECESIKKYLAVIVNGGERQLDAVASITGKQYDVVKNEVQKMIDKGFLKNAYINENTREVVLKSATGASENADRLANGVVSPAAQTRVIACPCCGANNALSNAVGECEYCGAPLK